jgi:hypothetical protein
MERKDFSRLVYDIAGILGYKVGFPDDYNNKAEMGKDHERLIISNGGYKLGDRIKVYGVMPRPKDGRYMRVSSMEITMAVTKTAEQMAKEIGRRFLPEYREKLAECLALIDEHDSAQSDQRASLERMAAVMGKDIHWHNEREANGAIYSYDGAISKVEAQYGGKVKIELKYSIPVDKAIRIIKAIQAIESGA